MHVRFIPALLAASLLLSGCHHDDAPSTTNNAPSEHDQAAAANALFLNQKTFDPWVFNTTDQNRLVNLYVSDGRIGGQFIAPAYAEESFAAGDYQNGHLKAYPPIVYTVLLPHIEYQQTLNMRTGKVTTTLGGAQTILRRFGNRQYLHPADWPRLWQTSDIVITGDPEAQQVTHANLFYLLSSTYPGSDHSIPPMGLSSNIYGGHIFWDAEVWMMPALVVQHPDYARSIIDYRYKLLGQAKKNAQAHGFAGAEYPGRVRTPARKW